MTASLTAPQINTINAMSAEQRYDHFISQAIELKAVWGLDSKEGWVILPDDGEDHLPIWSHAELASQWAAGEFADCQPQAIPLNEWLEKWLPGMDTDGLLAAVCPNQKGDAIVVSAEELLEDFKTALESN